MNIIDTSLGNSARRGRPRSDRRIRVVEQAQAHLDAERPMTLRHLFYLLISDGVLENSQAAYADLSGWICGARMEGVVPFESIVDGIRHTIKPSSWSGLEDFADTVRDAYRKDLWQRQADYIECWFEKDAIIGVIEDITRAYDIKLRPLRGQSSLTFLHDAAWELAQIRKPIYIYYFGDHDPSGYSIEDSARERLDNLLSQQHQPRDKYVLDCTAIAQDNQLAWNERFNSDGSTDFIYWRRLGFLPEDFSSEFDFEDGSRREVLRLRAKRSDNNYQKFVARFGSDDAAELDSLPMAEIRNRVEQTILSHINQAEWKALQDIEKLERESFNEAMAKIGKHS